MNAADIAKLAFAGSTSSAAGAGAAAGYGYFIPKTFEAVGTREGGERLVTNEDYYSVLYDQRAKVDELANYASWQKNKTITTDIDKITELKSWCQTKEKSNLDSVVDPAKYRDFFINLCTTKGITTVKGFLTKWRQTSDWIENKSVDSEKNLSFKGVFAVYRNSNDFLKWINAKKDSNVKEITSTTKNEEGYKPLQKVCEAGLKSKWGSWKNEDMEPYYFFCTVKNDTVKGRLESESKRENPNDVWTARTTFTGVKDKWYQTEGVQAMVKRTTHQEPVDDNEYKKWCEQLLNARLGSHEDIYPKEYKFVKQICKAENSTTTIKP